MITCKQSKHKSLNKVNVVNWASTVQYSITEKAIICADYIITGYVQATGKTWNPNVK